MLPDRVSNPGHLTYESGALPIALRGLVVLAVGAFSLDVLMLSVLSFSVPNFER